MSRTLTWEIGNVATFFGEKSPKVAAVSYVDASRDAAARMVANQTVALGSKMLAYEYVARRVGVSKDWLRRFIKSCPRTKPCFATGFKIIKVFAPSLALEFYTKLCERIEVAIEKERRLIADLTGEASNAAIDKTASASRIAKKAEAIGEGEVG
jgi:hypothetical protein